MTLWNPRTLFSRNETGQELSAAFDPFRTGGASPGFVDVEVGYAGGGSSVTAPGRNPIGFAPPSEPDRGVPGETRFHTEISFKRYASTVPPTASTDPGAGAEAEPSVVGQAWVTPPTSSDDRGDAADAEAVTPAVEVSAREVETEASPAAGGVHGEEAHIADERPVEAESVPFYKRELTFRRRKPSEPEAAATGVDDAESVPAGDAGVEAPSDPVATTTSDNPAVAEPFSADAPIVDEPIPGDTPLDMTPVAEAAAEAPVVDRPDDADVVSPEIVEGASASDDVPMVDAEVQTDAADLEESAAVGAGEPEGSLPVAEGESLGDDPAPDAPVGEEDARRPFARKRNGTRSAKPARKAGKGRKVVGLKIDASHIAAAVVVESNGVNELVQLAQRPIDSGLVLDGDVRDADALAHELKLFFEENDLPKKDVRIGLSSNRIGVRTFDIAGIDDDERFDNAVRFRAHEVLPVAQNESVLDYRILDERPTEGGETSRRILLVVAPRDQVNPYVEVARNAGIKLEGLDLEALSLLRAFVDPKAFAARLVDDTATVVVSIGHESTTLLVAGGGACEFTRVFRWGGETLQDAVMNELGVHPAEAATMLRHLSLSGPGRQYDGLDEESRTRAVEAVRLRLTPFARELVSSLQFYQTQPDSLGIGEIVLTGGTSHLEGLSEALHQMIGVAVRIGDPFARVTVSGEIDPTIEATIGSMAVPIGLAINDDQSRTVNLLPSEERAQARGRKPSLVKIAVPVAVAIPVAALGFMFVSAHGQVSSSQAELDAVESELAALPRPEGAVIDASVKGSQATRAQVVASLLGGRVAWDAVLRDVARVLPENVWLNSFQAQVAPTSTTGIPVAATSVPGVATAPTGVQIDGYTYRQTDVARLLARLATLPSLGNVSLTASKVETKGAKSIVHFQIAADLNPGGSR